MREIAAALITDTVARLCIEANYDLPPDVVAQLEKSAAEEDAPLAREMLDQILENARLASRDQVPICQDTGLAVVMVELGQDLHITGGSLADAINEGVRVGYDRGYLRRSVVADPLSRENTGDNTPAVIHVDLVPGDSCRIAVAPKGAGSENMSAVRMLKPSEGIEGVKTFVVETVAAAGANPCPPLVVGVGIGGSFEGSALLAKKALFRPLDQPNLDPRLAALESELLEAINQTGVGPAGIGGRTTALAVHVAAAPCHIASLPVAINVNCHAARHKEAVL